MLRITSWDWIFGLYCSLIRFPRKVLITWAGSGVGPKKICTIYILMLATEQKNQKVKISNKFRNKSTFYDVYERLSWKEQRLGRIDSTEFGRWRKQGKEVTRVFFEIFTWLKAFLSILHFWNGRLDSIQSLPK